MFLLLCWWFGLIVLGTSNYCGVWFVWWDLVALVAGLLVAWFIRFVAECFGLAVFALQVTLSFVLALISVVLV